MSQPAGSSGGAVAEVIDEVWRVFGDRDSLMPLLDADAVMVRAQTGELKIALPRLFELTAGDELGDVPRQQTFALLSSSDWQHWDPPERQAVVSFADTWWRATRTDEDPLVSVDSVLACLAYLGLPMLRWLGPWLEDLDGPGARHLADAVIAQFPDEAWAGLPDERSQVLAWARGEPVILGLTLIGGVHLAEGKLGEALDQLLG